MRQSSTRGTLLALLVVIASSSSFSLATSIPSTNDDNHEANEAVCPSSNEQCTATDVSSLSSVYVLGDLHGDVLCTVSWVNRTGLIANLFDSALISDASLPLHRRLNPASRWTWTDSRSTLVFMGDYVDKGPTSKQTVQFVRDLTLTFPNRVTALLGNHELELLRDRDARIKPDQRYASFSYASVHPGEYHNYLHDDDDITNDGQSTDALKDRTRSIDSDDRLILNLLYQATMEVYSHGAHDAIRVVPSIDPTNEGQHSTRELYAITDVIPTQHRALAKQRLEEYQSAYLNSYRSGTVLGTWLETRPILYFEEHVRTLFVHGGVHPIVGREYLKKGKESARRINEVWWEHSKEDALFDFLQNTTWGQIVYSLLTHRGNHPGYSKWETHEHVDDDPTDTEAVCAELQNMLTDMEGIDRIAVGHTPDFRVRFYCGEQFLALDSMLGRGIRATGNEYCPWPDHDMAGIPKVSRNGKYKCDDVPETCHGETVRIDSDGTVHILKL
ncbi:hypothetical protein ACHAW6_015254 [Cyclotella cf. meneghiniana]